MEKEERVKSITHIYYLNPKLQEYFLKFSSGREVVPRYFESFGKRPDTLQYPSDILSLVKKGATSFHASEEIWRDVLKINSDMSQGELNELRSSWDLLIDIDSPYLDYSKIAAKLVLEALENFRIKNYGIKFSGSKGFHIIVSGKAFPEIFQGQKMSEMFPEWPRAICEFLINLIRQKYNKEIANLGINFEAIEKRLNVKKEDFIENLCPNCGRNSKKALSVTFVCPECKTTIQRKNVKLTKRRLQCFNANCPGVLEIQDKKEYFYCEYCNISSFEKNFSQTSNKVVFENQLDSKDSENFEQGLSGNASGNLDLVLVAPRHLFRMPYALHEKTSLASVVIKKDQISSFSPKDASPLNIKLLEFLPNNFPGETERLLSTALSWKKNKVSEEQKMQNYNSTKFSEKKEIEIIGVTEQMFPNPIKKLLKGLSDGKKRGLFVLITFLRAVNFSREYVEKKIRDWNLLNKPPLKEGYIRSQIDWHFRQKKKILPPNYSNNSFYQDLGLIDSPQKSKNPLVDVIKKLHSKSN